MTYKEQFAATVLKARHYIKNQIKLPGTMIFALSPTFLDHPGPTSKEHIDQVIDSLSTERVIELADALSATTTGQQEPWRSAATKIVTEAYLKMDNYIRYRGTVDLLDPVPGKPQDRLTPPTYTVACLDSVKLRARELCVRFGIVYVIGHIETDSSEKPLRFYHPLTDLIDEELCQLADFLCYISAPEL